VRDLLRGFHGMAMPSMFGQFQSGIGDGVERRIRMELDLRHVGDDAEFVVSAAPTTATAFLRMVLSPSPDGTGKGDLSSSFSNATSSFMSSSRASGVCGQSMMAHHARPSAELERSRIAYGGVKPGRRGRWLMT